MNTTSTARPVLFPTHVVEHHAAQHSHMIAKTFPWKLHEMLELADQEGYENIVSWLPNGRSFKVYTPNDFVQKIMPNFFSQSKYKSFQRQLNLWGFERILSGPDKGGYFYPDFFVRDDRYQIFQMQRRKISKGTCTATAAATANKSNGVTGAVSTGIAVSGVAVPSSSSSSSSSPTPTPKRILRTTTTHTPTLSLLSTQTSTTPTTFATIPTTPMVLKKEKELSGDAGTIMNKNKNRKQCPEEDSHISSHRASLLKGNINNNNNNNTKVLEASHTQTYYGINTDVYISGDNKVPQADNFTPLSLSIKSSSSLPPSLSSPSPSSSVFSPAVSTSYKKEQDSSQLNIFTPSSVTPLHIYNGTSAGQGHGHGHGHGQAETETETTEQHAYHSLYPMADTGMNTNTKTNSAEDDVPETVFSAAESNSTVTSMMNRLPIKGRTNLSQTSAGYVYGS